MKFIVTMYQGGRTFTEEVYSNDVKGAKETAKVRKLLLTLGPSKCHKAKLSESM
jgi:hypothetical protein